MEEINDIIAQNISKLRKSKKLTQTDLANLLNYSDKAISKWERAESSPDISMLIRISEIFNVDLNYLITKHSDDEIANLSNPKFSLRSFLVTLMLCIAVTFISTIIFIYATLQNAENARKFWVAFVIMVPLWSIITIYYFKKER